MSIAAACHEVRAGDAGGKFFRGRGVAKGKPATLRFIIHRPRHLNCSTFFVWGFFFLNKSRPCYEKTWKSCANHQSKWIMFMIIP